MDELIIVGRRSPLFESDLQRYENELLEIIGNSKFLVIGGGGSIGQAVCKQLYKRKAKTLHIVDLNENYLAELVRDIRSSFDDLVENFDTFAIDCGHGYFEKFMERGNYDYIFNLSAMKHVRSENSAFSMYRMFETNVLNVIKTYNWAATSGASKYFCVSSDKAANPTNYMGATKRAMELCLMLEEVKIPITGARFANVAFSNGSLLESFRFRLSKGQPLSVPEDIDRYFITQEESGIICMLSALLCRSNEILFPQNEHEISLTNFKLIAERFLQSVGKKAVFIPDENGAKAAMLTLDTDKYWPVNIFKTDTVGEKPFEEFFTATETINTGKFFDLASVNFVSQYTKKEVHLFLKNFKAIEPFTPGARDEMISLVSEFVPSFSHTGGNKFLNQRM